MKFFPEDFYATKVVSHRNLNIRDKFTQVYSFLTVGVAGLTIYHEFENGWNLDAATAVGGLVTVISFWRAGVNGSEYNRIKDQLGEG